MAVTASSKSVPGLTAKLDRLCHHMGGASLPPDKPHAFVYYVTIINSSERTVRLLGRKWVLHHCDGSFLVVEGDCIVGETPQLRPGERFSYNSYHVTSMNAEVQGCFHGIDEGGLPIHVALPPFRLEIPGLL